jgi:hypothetical protein
MTKPFEWMDPVACLNSSHIRFRLSYAITVCVAMLYRTKEIFDERS